MATPAIDASHNRVFIGLHSQAIAFTAGRRQSSSSTPLHNGGKPSKGPGTFLGSAPLQHGWRHNERFGSYTVETLPIVCVSSRTWPHMSPGYGERGGTRLAQPERAPRPDATGGLQLEPRAFAI